MIQNKVLIINLLQVLAEHLLPRSTDRKCFIYTKKGEDVLFGIFGVVILCSAFAIFIGSPAKRNRKQMWNREGKMGAAPAQTSL